jgi:hypothetical protein
MVSGLSIVKRCDPDLRLRNDIMNIRTGGYVAALLLGAAAFAAPAEAQFKGVGGQAGGVGGHVGAVGAPRIGAAGIGAHPSFGANAGFAARPNIGAGAGFAAHPGGSAAFAGRSLGSAPLVTGRSVAAAPNAGFAAARPGFTPSPALHGAWRGGQHRRFWPYAAAAAGAGLAYGVGGYGYDYDYPYDTGYYDPAYDVAPAIAPVVVDTDEGGSCATPVLVCRLYEPAPIGYGCSCTVGGGQARGVVQP